MSKVDPTKNIKFNMEVATDLLEILDVKLKFDKEWKQITVNVFAKDANSFTYIIPSTCFLTNNIESIHKTFALRLRRIWDSDKKIEKLSTEYQIIFWFLENTSQVKWKSNFQALKNSLEKRQEHLD